MRRLVVAVAVCALVAVGACSTGGTATPSATTPALQPSESLSTTSPSVLRPREIKLDGKDACQLLTSKQLSELKMERPGRPRKSDAYQATGCNWNATGATGGLVPVTMEGIEVWTSGKRTGQPTTIDPIFGFPAITVTDPEDELRCDVMVDTADGQYLTAGYQVTPSFTDKFPEPCDGARQFAEAALHTLLN